MSLADVQPGEAAARAERRPTSRVFADLVAGAGGYVRRRLDDLSTIRDGEPRKWVYLCAALTIAVLTLGFVVDLAVVSRFEYRAAQARSFNQLRNELALGSAPVSQFDRHGHLLRLGTPVALLEVPKLHMRLVVGEGSTPEVLMRGPGLLRSTVLPGQAGTSAILGRAAAYGGPFHAISSLHKGDRITVTTGAGQATFSVIGVRHAHDPIPPLKAGAGRLTLVTASGLPFLPSGLVRVDADLTANALPAVQPAVATTPRSEQPLGTDSSNLWQLVLLLEAFLAAAIAAVWSWHRWGHAQAWIVFFPVFALLAYVTNDQFARLLPNLM